MINFWLSCFSLSIFFVSKFLLVSGYWHLFVSNSLLELLSGFLLKHKVVNSAEFLFFTMSIFKPNISDEPLIEQSSLPKWFQTFAEERNDIVSHGSGRHVTTAWWITDGDGTVGQPPQCFATLSLTQNKWKQIRELLFEIGV